MILPSVADTLANASVVIARPLSGDSQVPATLRILPNLSKILANALTSKKILKS
jgi:hypothetical protein